MGRVPPVFGYLWAGPATAIGLAWTLRRLVPLDGGALALTLGHVVLGRDASALAATRAHERVHVRQYELWGPLFLPAYALASVVALVAGGHPYRDNWFEREARRAEARPGGGLDPGAGTGGGGRSSR
jgi:hypothetical protein